MYVIYFETAKIETLNTAKEFSRFRGTACDMLDFTMSNSLTRGQRAQFYTMIWREGKGAIICQDDLSAEYVAGKLKQVNNETHCIAIKKLQLSDI